MGSRSHIKSILTVLIVLDFAVFISMSMILISDDSMAPANPPEPEPPEIIEISNDGHTRFFEMYGDTFMQDLETGKIRLVSIAQLHLTLTPCIGGEPEETV